MAASTKVDRYDCSPTVYRQIKQGKEFAVTSAIYKGVMVRKSLGVRGKTRRREKFVYGIVLTDPQGKEPEGKTPEDRRQQDERTVLVEWLSNYGRRSNRALYEPRIPGITTEILKNLLPALTIDQA